MIIKNQEGNEFVIAGEGSVVKIGNPNHDLSCSIFIAQNGHLDDASVCLGTYHDQKTARAVFDNLMDAYLQNEHREMKAQKLFVMPEDKPGQP